MTILIIIDGKIYRAKEKWPIAVEIMGAPIVIGLTSAIHLLSSEDERLMICDVGGKARDSLEYKLKVYNDHQICCNILAACFDEVKPVNHYGECYLMETLTGKE